jgi:periplasmic protein TonB
MPGLMFQDVVCPRARANSKWYTVPLSFVVHTFVLAILIVAPLIATNLLPKPRAIMQFVTPYVPIVPTAPPPVRQVAASSPVSVTPGAPLVAPETIGAETGVVFEPAHVDISGIESIIGADIGQITVEAPPPAPPLPAGPLPVGGNIKPPARTKYVAPQYPDIARNARIQGIVIIEAVIGTDGKVEQARVLRPQPLLDEAALAAVRAWEYTPTLLNGQPTAVIMAVTVHFKLSP